MTDQTAMSIEKIEWPQVDEEVLRPLPPVLRAVVKALGFGRASQFLDAHGGMPHTIPKVKSTALGLSGDELQRLRITLAVHMDHAGRVSLPKSDKLFKLVRDEQITKGKATQTIAQQVREYKLSNRTIMNLRRALTKDERMRETKLKRNLSFDNDELLALKSLAEEKLHTSTGNAIYAKILNKLNRAAMHATPKVNVVQFDLF